MSESPKIFLQAVNGQRTDRVPFWFMRQAGRYLPEYRELRAEKGGFLEMAYDPETACEITMQPIRRFGMDAAIIFSDILTIPHALGQHLEFVQGEGPKLGSLDIDALSFEKFDEVLAPVYEALRLTAAQLRSENFHETALIGFAGAPWTVACYMVEGGGSKDYSAVKRLAYGDPEKFKMLMDLLVGATSRYLIKQIEAGAEAIQIFDSHAGVLDPHGFQFQCIEPTKRIVQAIKATHPDVPVIGFPRGGSMHTKAYATQTGIDAIGLDPSMCTMWARDNLQSMLPVQGNLDPIRLLAGGDGLEKAARKILKEFAGGPFVFNLGHGIHKETPVEHVEQLVKILRS